MTKHKHLTLSDRNDIQLGLERREEIPKLLDISKIPAEDVSQSSKLLQHKI